MVSRLEKDGWTAPEEAAFAKDARDFRANAPHVAPDGKKLYIGSERPRSGRTQPEDGLWVGERTAADFG